MPSGIYNEATCGHMYRKHAVWCQCAVVFTCVLAMASVLSVQYLTVGVDVYWSSVLVTTAALHFILAEHAPVGGISTQRWMRLQPNTLAHAVLLVWSLCRWHTAVAWLHLPGLVAALAVKQANIVLAVACLARLVFAWDACLGVMLLLLAVGQYKPNVINKSMASREQRQRFLAKATQIVLQSVALWCVRCEHRFPHVVRWTPLFMGLVGLAGAMLFCHVYVAPTKVSHNAIIVAHGHGMAASLTAAEQCPICRQHLTALDMESSFSETSG